MKVLLNRLMSNSWAENIILPYAYPIPFFSWLAYRLYPVWQRAEIGHRLPWVWGVGGVLRIPGERAGPELYPAGRRYALPWPDGVEGGVVAGPGGLPGLAGG